LNRFSTSGKQPRGSPICFGNSSEQNRILLKIVGGSSHSLSFVELRVLKCSQLDQLIL
jgi:hypothetical protein